MSSTWILPFKGRNKAGAYQQNFVWSSGSVYVMDNHRAALWCWAQEIDLNRPHSLIHIDQHADCLQSRLDEWVNNTPSLSSTLTDYLEHRYKSEFGESQVIRWDNYLSIYLNKFGEILDKFYFATHGDGDSPNYDSVIEIGLWDLPGTLDTKLVKDKGPWIVNVDLDYFFWNSGKEIGLIVSDEYLEKTFSCLKKAIDAGAVAVTTICLTPDVPYTPGWDASERLAIRILEIMGIDFSLPQSD